MQLTAPKQETTFRRIRQANKHSVGQFLKRTYPGDFLLIVIDPFSVKDFVDFADRYFWRKTVFF